MPRLCLMLTVLALAWPIGWAAEPAKPRVLLEVGRDYPETRLFSACLVREGKAAPPRLAAAGFSQTGPDGLADLTVFEITDAGAVIRSRIMWGGQGNSSIRTLRAADLDGDGRDELIALGRAGNEDKDSTGELRVFTFKDNLLQLAASSSWQSGKYTHGFGMDVADLDGDGKAEIVTSGFFRGAGHEQAELRVWRLDGSRLQLLATQSWGSKDGHTRLNSVALGDVTGDGRFEIVAGGRTGQVHGPNDTTQAEADQITVWSFAKDRLQLIASHEDDPKSRSRFRELRLANLDGKPGLEILAAGRSEAPGQGPKSGTGGGGNGKGGGAGKGEGAAKEGIRPTLRAFQVQGERLTVLGEAPWGQTLGEVRDLAVLGQADKLRVATILADDLKPQRQALLATWKWDGKTFQKENSLTAAFGDETRARQIVVWPTPSAPVLLTVGFVKHDERWLGQVIRWSEQP